MEMQSLEFTLLVFSLALAQCFLAMVSFLPFGIVMYILYHYMLEVWDLLFQSDSQGITVKRLHEYQKSLNF